MKKLLISLAVIGVIVLMIGSWISSSYNSFVTMNENIDTAWSHVETQYQRRFDLVPNLVSSTKGVLKQEQAVFGAIAEARTKYAGTKSASNERVEAMNQYEGALARLLVIIENYPQLRSVETVRALMDELAGTENRVLVARDRYNEQVRTYNVEIKRFPKNLLANVFGYNAKTFFESVEEASVTPNVEL